ncbi:hypothetical protein [Edaphobacter aggregans]|uniref:hypothetical protein n=1 Tax=Edaphobacter aggregans TaxID=570835 RepID=UPI00054F06C7|nr:hypothetical protein [Edaphobacter aggregans]
MNATAEVIEGTEAFDLMMLARMGEHELINTLVQACKRYVELVAQNKQTHIATLEDKLDELITTSRNLKANAEKLHNATFETMRSHADAENEMRRADNALAQLHYGARHTGLSTRAETAGREKQIEQAKKRCHDAAFAHSMAATAIRNATMLENEAIAAANAALGEAKNVRGQLEFLNGVAKVRTGNGLFIS